MLDRESGASEPYGFASTILMSPFAARILIAACPPPLTNMSIFAAAADAVRSTARSSKSFASGRLHRNIDFDLFQPHAIVGFLRRVDLKFVRVRSVNQYGTVMVLNTYVCVWLDRVDPLQGFLEEGLTFRAAACE